MFFTFKIKLSFLEYTNFDWAYEVGMTLFFGNGKRWDLASLGNLERKRPRKMRPAPNLYGIAPWGSRTPFPPSAS